MLENKLISRCIPKHYLFVQNPIEIKNAHISIVYYAMLLQTGCLECIKIHFTSYPPSKGQFTKLPTIQFRSTLVANFDIWLRRTNSTHGVAHSHTHLPAHVVDESFHAWLHAERMLARQQFRVAIPVQAHATREQLLKVLHDL